MVESCVGVESMGRTVSCFTKAIARRTPAIRAKSGDLPSRATTIDLQRRVN